MKRVVSTARSLLRGLIPILFVSISAFGQDAGEIDGWRKISNDGADFPDRLESDAFARAIAVVGPPATIAPVRIAVGAPYDRGGGTFGRGAVWLLDLAIDGSGSNPRKIGDGVGGFTGTLEDGDEFGTALAWPGDLDGDGNHDLVVGAYGDDDGGGSSANRGALWVLFLDASGGVKTHQKISDTQGGFTGVLADYDGFGYAVASIGDVDGDGVADLLAGAPYDDDGFNTAGAAWVLFLNANGTVKAHQKISATQGGFGGTLGAYHRFGSDVAGIGDVDGDGVEDVAVGAAGDGDGGTFGFGVGAVWVLFLNTNGTVKAQQKISRTQGGFSGTIDDGSEFGEGVGAIGDLNGDGTADLAVGARGHAFGQGAVWVLFLNANGTVKASNEIGSATGFGGVLGSYDQFGDGVAGLGDLDADGILDLLIGAPLDQDGGNHGALWTLIMNGDGSVGTAAKIGDMSGGMEGTLDEYDEFGAAVVSLGDLDGDGVQDLAVGAPGDDAGLDTFEQGAVWVLFLDAMDQVREYRRISRNAGGFGGTLATNDRFGAALAALGDLDGAGGLDVAIGAPGGMTTFTGSIWIATLASDGSVSGETQITSLTGGFTGTLATGDAFGAALTSLGDLDGDGVADLAVGAPGTDDGSFDAGAVWILFLNTDGTVRTQQKISATAGGFTGTLDAGDKFGGALASPGDLNRDGIPELAVGAPFDDDGLTNAGAVWILFLDASGQVTAQQKISQSAGGFGGTLQTGDRFGVAIAALGKLDGDWIGDLAVGAPMHNAGGLARGAIYFLTMNEDGTVASTLEASDAAGGFGGTVADGDGFGSSIASLGNFDGDALLDLAVGAPGDDAGGTDHGATWLLHAHQEAWTTSLGGGLAGLFGVTPILTGSGTLAPGSTYTLSLSFARPDSVAFLVVGFAPPANLAFMGGTLVPTPLLLVPLVTNYAGDLILALPWPMNVGSDLTLVYQYWIVDPVAVAGYSASNGIASTTP